MNLRAAFALTLLASLTGCSRSTSKDGATTVSPAASKTPSAFVVPPEKANTRYMRMRGLLERPVEDRRRSTELFGLVRPLCTEAEARKDFIDTAAWSIEHADEQFYLPSRVTLDMLEYVASVCGRVHPEGLFELLDDAQALLADEPRLPIIRARSLAAAGRLEEALSIAHKAAAEGHSHAMVLAANIEARRARDAAPKGWTEGMLDRALSLAHTGANEAWPAIDLAALLATRARLLRERAFWTEGQPSAKDRIAAAQVFERLLLGPFPEEVRSRSGDALCFAISDLGLESDACKRAAGSYNHLGAAVLADRVPSQHPRLEPLRALGASFETLGKGDLVLVVFRGDEQELLEWGFPSAHLLRRIGASGADVLLVDRTRTKRGPALVRRVAAWAGLAPWRFLDGDHVETLSCVSAVLADRRTPAGCPLDPDLLSALEGRAAPKVSILVGRGLEPEIEDLRLYQHPVVLASFRKSKKEEELSAWLKSLSDVFVVVPPRSPS